MTLEQAATLNQLITERARVRHRLRDALRSGSAERVRLEVVEILAEFGSGTVLAAGTDDCAETLRDIRDTEPDSAPSVPLQRPTGGA